MAANETNHTPAVATLEEFITKAEIARRLKKQVRTIDNWMRSGLLPYYKIGRSVNFKWSEVEAHLGQNCRVCRLDVPKADRDLSSGRAPIICAVDAVGPSGRAPFRGMEDGKVKMEEHLTQPSAFPRGHESGEGSDFARNENDHCY